MATFSKIKLSGSTSGRGIKVVQTATAGTAIHTAVAGAADYDEVYLYAVNSHTAAVTLTIEFGGVTSPDDLIKITIPITSGLFLVVPGLVINGGLGIAAFASVANVITIFGFANRITA
ncbi:hypothetical protein [Candidatus Magnetobacterium casense]|uniref:Uncharacterized protein n=1 Tax=Candidatus Magnetobacterium casense TaxID=1455061 RepID=A0ABS6S3H9_9BACT|nr:hypothetical protein [Candidatus Magnetobacterium casensis]MBV6343409.1 hypothetical protein [Candidatus Magnetobacterium casensis]